MRRQNERYTDDRSRHSVDRIPARRYCAAHVGGTVSRQAGVEVVAMRRDRNWRKTDENVCSTDGYHIL